MFNLKKEKVMEMDKKPHLDFLKTLSKSSLMGNLYGKLFAVKDMQIFLIEKVAANVDTENVKLFR